MRLTLTVHPYCLETAKRASQALDEDSGGIYAFEQQDEQGNYFYPVELSQAFVEKINYLIGNPAYLHAFISQQFAARFPDDPIPTLSECEALCASMVLS